MKRFIIMYDNGDEDVYYEVSAKSHEDAVTLSGIDLKRISKILQVTEEWTPAATWTSKKY